MNTSIPIPAASRERAVKRVSDYLLATLPGKELEVIVKERKKRRSDEQNRALWGVAYKALRDATGNDPADLHEFFLGEWGGWEVVEVMGQKRRRPMRRSSKLSTQEFSDYYAFIQRRAAEAGFFVPDPGEVA